MHAAEEEIALGRYVCNIGWYPALLAKLPHLSRSVWVVNGAQHHVGAIEVLGLKGVVDMRHLLLGHTEGDFFVQPGLRAYDGDSGIGIEGVQDAACCDLSIDGYKLASQVAQQYIFQDSRGKPHFAASDHENVFVPDLPGHNQGSSALDFREFLRHSGCDRGDELLGIVSVPVTGE